MVVGTWDSCCYILRKDLLGRRACHREEALWLKLAGDGTEKHMQMASPQDQEVPHQTHTVPHSAGGCSHVAKALAGERPYMIALAAI